MLNADEDSKSSLTAGPGRLVLARDLQLIPGPQEYLAGASLGYSLLPGPGSTKLVLARDLQQLTLRPREYLASASQGPPAYSRAPGVPS